MIPRRLNLALLLGLAGSVVAHALFFGVFGPRPLGPVRWGPAPRSDSAKVEQEMTVVLEPEPEPEPPKPSEFAIGEKTASGYAVHEVLSEQVPEARLAEQDQARLSMDLIGELGEDDAAAPSTGEEGAKQEAGGAGPPKIVIAIPVPLPSDRTTPFGLDPGMKLPQAVKDLPDRDAVRVQPGEADQRAGETTPAQANADAAREPPTEESPKVAPAEVAVVVSEAPSAAPTPQRQTGEAGAPSRSRPRGDPLPPSDSESDPFSQFGSAKLQAGRLEVQFGRKVKTRRPKLLLGGAIDVIYGQHGVDVVMRVSTDATGKVTGVRVTKSSGSNAIDTPIVVAMYEWWFEPPTDEKGNPRPDEFKFTIGLR